MSILAQEGGNIPLPKPEIPARPKPKDEPHVNRLDEVPRIPLRSFQAMALQRQQNLDEAKDWFTRLGMAVHANTALRHLDCNIEVENFFRDLLNLVFGWSLRNANWSGSVNQDSFDLEDRRNRIAVQVTSTTSAAKIRNTLESFIPSHRDDFDRLIFVYPSMTISSSSADFSKQLSGFGFNAASDRMGLGDILREIQNLKVGPQDAVIGLLRRELKPLGAALQMGVDRNVEVIISIIRYISEGTPSSEALPEMKPDAILKLTRFQEHAEFLKRQFTGYVGFYRAAEEARQAVGYDAVRALRCAAWLKDGACPRLRITEVMPRKPSTPWWSISVTVRGRQAGITKRMPSATSLPTSLDGAMFSPTQCHNRHDLPCFQGRTPEGLHGPCGLPDPEEVGEDSGWQAFADRDRGALGKIWRYQVAPNDLCADLPALGRDR
ncbi:MAG: SMEK domain-containing protein [Verrucomicrobia bacterium]|nr:SMEK domain-containing protein [Verrucomicrobiota bacterium]